FAVIGFNLLLCLIRSASMPELVIFTVLLWLLGFLIAASSVYCSAETMELAPPDNKVVAMAWSCAFFYCGSGCSRLFSSFLLHNEIFRSGKLWGAFLPGFTAYQALFFLYGVLLIPLIALLYRIPAVTGKKP
ncbi:MAG: hypothetical protein J6S58_04920, partial [Lentisphaeria bacterium]|nr:hypothetical protein [Lentisphaeria bacterium]